MSRVSRQAIAEAAIAIADDEGLDAVSMRKVAARLEVGTMTLYHYVRGKDDLYALVTDAIMGELVAPELPDGWREGLTAVARRTKAVFDDHPWILASMIGAGEAGGQVGPNAMRHFEQSLAAVASLDVPADVRIDIITLVDEYVWGYVFANAHDEAESAASDFRERMEAYIAEQLGSGEFPHTRALIAGDEDVAAAFDRVIAAGRDPARFERGLRRLLDGIEAEIRPSRPGSARSAR